MNGRAILGLAFLSALIVATAIGLTNLPGSATLAPRLVDHIARRMVPMQVRFDQAPKLSVGDPLYTVENNAFAKQGVVERIEEGTPTIVHIRVDPTVVRRCGDRSRVLSMTPKGDLAWVMRTLLPPDLRTEVIANLKSGWEERRKDTLDALKGPLLAAAGDTVGILVDSLPDALRQHAESRERFFQRFREEIYLPELEPLIREEFISRLEERLAPMAGSMGEKIWNELSAGDFVALSWIATKDAVGAADEKEMAKRLSELLRKKALPVIEVYAPKAFKEASQAIADGWADPEVRKKVDAITWKVMDHPAFQEWTGAVLKTWITDNQRIRDRLMRAWKSPEIRDPLQVLYGSLEPRLEKALEEVLTTADRQGMDHQLVRVLRHVVLKKDKYYLVLDESGGIPFAEGLTLMGRIGADQ